MLEGKKCFHVSMESRRFTIKQRLLTARARATERLPAEAVDATLQEALKRLDKQLADIRCTFQQEILTSLLFMSF